MKKFSLCNYLWYRSETISFQANTQSSSAQCVLIEKKKNKTHKITKNLLLSLFAANSLFIWLSWTGLNFGRCEQVCAIVGKDACFSTNKLKEHNIQSNLGDEPDHSPSILMLAAHKILVLHREGPESLNLDVWFMTCHNTLIFFSAQSGKSPPVLMW